MVRAITFHALERLLQRRSLVHAVRHLRKVQAWGLPDDGELEHNGYRYITRDKTIITVLPPTRQWWRKHKGGRK